MVTKKDPVDRAIGKALASVKPKPKGSCPDDNTVAAYLEGGLPASERVSFEDHASSCGRCQELVALALKLLEAEQPEPSPVTTLAHARRRLLLRLPIPALALLVVAVAIGIIFRDQKESPEEPARQVAQLRSASKDQAVPAEEARMNRPSATRSDEMQRASAPKSQIESGLKAKRLREKDVDQVAVVAGAPSQPKPEAKLAVLKDAKGDFREGERRREAGAVELKKTEAIAPAPNARTLGAVAHRQEGQQIPPQLVIARFSQQIPREQNLNRAAQNAERVGAYGGGAQLRKVGSRLFHFVSEYWVDARCGEHPDSEIVEITGESLEFAEIRRELPEIEELRASGIPILLHWNRKNYVIR